MTAPEPIRTARLELPALSVDQYDRLLAGDRAGVGGELGAEIGADWLADARWLIALRREQLRAHPDHEAWLIRPVLRRETGERPEAIGYVNFHGTSTVLNDAVESRCVRQLFGAHAERLAGSSTKSMIGHPQGASGAAGVVTATLALSREFLPPTINHTTPDPACDLDFIPNTGRAAQIDAALCNCLGFGSKNSAVVIGRVK